MSRAMRVFSMLPIVFVLLFAPQTANASTSQSTPLAAQVSVRAEKESKVAALKKKKQALKKKKKQALKKKQATLKRNKVVTVAKRYTGVRYKPGGTSPKRGFDCSGFTQYVYKKVGKKLPRTSGAQRFAGKRVSRPLPGDLVWTPGHVAIYVGKGKIIDAPKPGKKITVRGMWQRNPTFVRVVH